MDKKTFGQRGEDIAERYLTRRGYTIITNNWYRREGEIDIIAKDKNGCLVFVEVKTRRSTKYGLPEEAITPRKMRNLVRASEYYLMQKRLFDYPARIDVIAIMIDYSTRHIRLKHFRNAISA